MITHNSLLSDNSSIFYRELYNGLVINELEFNEDEPYWKILCLCNKQIYSIDMLIEQLSLAKDSVTSIIDSLAKEKLLYRNHDYSEIVTIINIDKLK